MFEVGGHVEISAEVVFDEVGAVESAAFAEDVFAVVHSGFGIEHAELFEALEHVAGADESPLVAVVAGLVAGEVSEGGLEVGAGDFVVKFDLGEEVDADFCGVDDAVFIGVVGHVDKAVVELVFGEHSRANVFGGDHAFEEVIGEGLAGFIVAGKGFEDIGIPDPVFEHLGGGFDEIALDGGAGEFVGVDIAEEGVEAVAELVEEGFDLIVGHEGGFVFGGFGKVADEGGKGKFGGAILPFFMLAETPLGGVAIFVITGMEVDEEVAEEFVGFFVPAFEEAGVFVPEGESFGGGGGGDFFVFEAVEGLGDGEEAVDDALEREVFADFFRIDGVAGLLELVHVEAHVPGVEVGGGISGVFSFGGEEFVPVELGFFADEGAEFFIEVEDGVSALGHFDFGFVVGGGFVAEEMGGVGAEFDDFFKDGNILFTAASFIGEPGALSGEFVGAEVTDGNESGVVHGDDVEVAGAFEVINPFLGHAGEFITGDEDGGFILADVFFEFDGKFAGFLLEGGEFFAVGGGEIHAGASIIAEGVGELALLDRSEFVFKGFLIGGVGFDSSIEVFAFGEIDEPTVEFFFSPSAGVAEIGIGGDILHEEGHAGVEVDAGVEVVEGAEGVVEVSLVVGNGEDGFDVPFGAVELGGDGGIFGDG